MITFLSPSYWAWVKVREIVLRLPLGMRFQIEDLKKENNEIIFGLYEEDKIIGGAQLVVEDTGAKMRQVAVLSKYQNLGLGTLLLDHIEKYCIEKGINSIYCHARAAAVPFYLNNQYQIIGDLFEEVGIPHYKMSKNLTQN